MQFLIPRPLLFTKTGWIIYITQYAYYLKLTCYINIISYEINAFFILYLKNIIFLLQHHITKFDNILKFYKSSIWS